jgi:hypothetical protein
VSEEIVLVEYRVKYERNLFDRPTWTLYRVNASRQWWGIADYFSEEAANNAANLLNTLSGHETVHAFAARKEFRNG